MFVNLSDFGLTPSVTFHLKNRWNTHRQREIPPFLGAAAAAGPPNSHGHRVRQLVAIGRHRWIATTFSLPQKHLCSQFLIFKSVCVCVCVCVTYTSSDKVRAKLLETKRTEVIQSTVCPAGCWKVKNIKFVWFFERLVKVPGGLVKYEHFPFSLS